MTFFKKSKPSGMTGGRPRVKVLSVSKVKKAIQAKLREKAIERDKTCVIGQNGSLLPLNWRVCGERRQDGEIIVQAEHLVGRANSASYGDMDNIVLLCKRHHFYFKTQHAALYWDIIRKYIGEKRWAKVQKWEHDHTPHHFVVSEWRALFTSLQ